MNKYDAFLHKNKPSSESLGLLPITICYFKDIAASVPLHYPIAETENISFAKLGVMCQKALDTDTIMVIDIENWPIGDPRFLETAQWVRNNYSSVRFGFWHSRGQGKELQKYVDLVTTSLYPHTEDYQQWYDNAEKQMLADSFGEPWENPVLVFIRPEYTKNAGDELRDKVIPTSYWFMIRRKTEELPNVDGIIYWGGSKMEWPENGIPV